ncbi:nucleotide-diphospho-sugar transferase [Chytriomyces cf. hyalinus JEL632]|nr:nucleotide-diphospho-sugar transferase [Chytriomyces cf. hyalinus JEL632]
MSKTPIRLSKTGVVASVVGSLALVSLAFNVWLFTVSSTGAKLVSQLSDAPTGSQPIPRIIHQSWKTHDIPKDRFGNWDETWKLQNPEYKYILWDDTENEALIRNHYPWFLNQYLSYDRGINRADAVRVFYMHKFGGVYVDLDIAAYKPLDNLLLDHHLVLAKMEVPGEHSWEHKHEIPNAWMASRPGHSFWMHCAHLMMSTNSEGTEEKTGPVMIWNALKTFNTSVAVKTDPIHVAGTESIYPYSWSFEKTDDAVHRVCSKQRKSFDETKCRQLVDPDHRAYAISYWSHTW